MGLAVARELVRRRPGARSWSWRRRTTSPPTYYKPGSLKAELCTRGRELLKDYCAEHGIAYDECGKLVVAVEESELARFDNLERTATDNRVPGLRRIGREETAEIEPAAVGLAALHSPKTAITDFPAVARAFAEEVSAAGGEVRTGTEVTGIERRAGRIEVSTGHGAPIAFDNLVVCAGLYADRVSALIDGEPGPRIVPFRGEYLRVADAKRNVVRGLIYPVPDPRYPFLGVHYTRRVDGSLEVGPNAVLATRREGYRRRDVSATDLRDLLSWPGFWHLARAPWRTGITEVRGSLSKTAYMRVAQKYVPQIDAGDVVRGGAGVRAQAVDRDGSLVDDFRLTHSEGVTCVRNAPSPAATSSLARSRRTSSIRWRAEVECAAPHE